MSDNFPATISIGGKITQKQLNGIVNALYSDTGVSIEEIEETLRNYEFFECGEAKYGEFENTEQYLEDHDIEFDRKSSGYGEYTAENRYYRPYKDKRIDITCIADADNRPVILMEDLQRVLKEFNGVDRLNVLTDLTFPLRIPALTPLVILD